MRDVVIIGGGLSGLAAACELERLGVVYTLIEVKRRLGGGITSAQKDAFVFDSGPMCHPVEDPDVFKTTLDGLGLNAVAMVPGQTGIVFAGGTAALVDALAERITAPVMRRMAVSTVGEIIPGRRFSICLENGMVLDARALIIAAPARYAERMLHTLVPEAAYQLLDYRYDTVARVSVGYCVTDPSALTRTAPPDSVVFAVQQLDHPDRVPPGGLILQAAMRFDSGADIPEERALVAETVAAMRWPEQPGAHHIGLWPESDPVMFRDDGYIDMLAAVNGLLPDRVALIGSDYIPSQQLPRLDQRIGQGIHAAQRVANRL